MKKQSWHALVLMLPNILNAFFQIRILTTITNFPHENGYHGPNKSKQSIHIIQGTVPMTLFASHTVLMTSHIAQYPIRIKPYHFQSSNYHNSKVYLSRKSPSNHKPPTNHNPLHHPHPNPPPESP